MKIKILHYKGKNQSVCIIREKKIQKKTGKGSSKHRSNLLFVEE